MSDANEAINDQKNDTIQWLIACFDGSAKLYNKNKLILGEVNSKVVNITQYDDNVHNIKMILNIFACVLHNPLIYLSERRFDYILVAMNDNLLFYEEGGASIDVSESFASSVYD